MNGTFCDHPPGGLAYLKLAEGTFSHSTNVGGPCFGINFDWDKDGTLLGIESLNAREHFPAETLARLGAPAPGDE